MTMKKTKQKKERRGRLLSLDLIVSELDISELYNYFNIMKKLHPQKKES